MKGKNLMVQYMSGTYTVHTIVLCWVFFGFII